MPRAKEAVLKPNGTLANPRSEPRAKKHSNPVSPSTASKLKKQLNKTMGSEEPGQFVRSPNFAKLTPRRSTRSAVKVTDSSLLMEMPPPKSVGSVVSKRRRTAAASTSSAKKSTKTLSEDTAELMSAIHDASTADMSSRKRRVAKSLALNIQSDSDDVKSDADDLAAKSRSRKSRASKAKPIEGRVTDDASDREMAKPNKANRKSKKNYVHAPSTDSEYHTGASSPEQNIIKQALVADADQNNLTDDIDPEPEPEQSNANLTEDLDDDSHGLVMSSDAEQQLAHDNATSTASFKRNKSAQEEDAVVNFSLVKRGLETSGEPAQLISPGNMSGVGILPTDEPTVIKSVKFATIDLTESPQCVLSSPSSASSPTASKPLNVTFSPIQPSEELAMLKHSRTSSTPKLLMSNGSVAVSTGKKPMKRLSHHTPRSIKATNAPNAPSSSLSSKSRGTPYVHKVARPNMSNVTNTSVFSSAKKAKLLDGAKSLLPPKRVTFNTPSTNKSAVKAAVVTTTKPHTSTVKTNGVSARVVQFNGSAIEPVSASVTKRTIPNFQYIHKKMFDQMESVVDVVERQKMRSAKKENEAPVKTFTNLAKTRPVVRKLDNTVDGTIGRQRCDLASAKKSVKALNNTVSTVTGPSRVKLASSKKNINASSTLVEPMSKPHVLKRNIAEAKRSQTINTEQSREERRQRMFKGRDLPVAKAVREREQKRSMLKGVRLNKRFDLQMKFRDTTV